MQKIIIKHLKGTRKDQVDQFELPITELIIGREVTANIKIDEKDDWVSRKHAKITQDSSIFKLEAQSDRNGTFVNGKRILQPVTLNVGDTIRLSEQEGVELSFDLDPRPENTAKSTRYQQSAGQTREQPKATQFDNQQNTSQVKSSIGKETVERLLFENTSQTRKRIINITSGIIALVTLGAGILYYQGKKGEESVIQALDNVKKENEITVGEIVKKIPTGQSATKIAEQYSNSTVYIEASWKLFKTDTGEQIYHVAVCHDDKYRFVDCNNKNSSKPLPLYLRVDNKVIEPVLSPKDGLKSITPHAKYFAIGGFGSGHTGSGFVVKENGFILTNRHVAAAWDTRYNWSSDKFPGILIACSDSNCRESKFEKILSYGDPDLKYLTSWVPSSTQNLGGKPAAGRAILGKNDYLDVTFPHNHSRIPASLVRVSDVADVALIKIEIPQEIRPVVITNSDKKINPGDLITITGYPSISPNVEVKIKSQDPLNRSGEWRVMPTPTVATGTIAKVIDGNAKMRGETTSEYFSEMGDVYQLNVNTIGEGNSGGPVFNDEGNVIGLFTYGCNCGDARNSYAVPIKYGLELMGVNPLN